MSRAHVRSVVAALAFVALGCSDASGPPAEPIDFEAFEHNEFSQYGEDGIIQKLFSVIEPGPRYAVEFGAGDGVSLSNTRNLFLNHGWGGLLIEGSPKLAQRMHENYAELPKVETLEAWVYPGNIEVLFEDNGVPLDLDLLVIDIDSNDYYVWKVIHKFRPKVVQIEVNPFFAADERMVIDFHPLNFWDKTDYAGASLKTMIALGRDKGYEPVYVTTGGFNAFFVDREYFDRFGIAANESEDLWKPALGLNEMFNRAPEGRGDVPFEDPYLDFGYVKIKKKFRTDR